MEDFQFNFFITLEVFSKMKFVIPKIFTPQSLNYILRDNFSQILKRLNKILEILI
jgi:hypothetical protein